jgi:hypothetical protein
MAMVFAMGMPPFRRFFSYPYYYKQMKKYFNCFILRTTEKPLKNLRKQGKTVRGGLRTAAHRFT